jgi:hypothetical protein
VSLLRDGWRSHRVYLLLLSLKQLTPSVSARQLPQRGELLPLVFALCFCKKY